MQSIPHGATLTINGSSSFDVSRPTGWETLQQNIVEAFRKRRRAAADDCNAPLCWAVGTRVQLKRDGTRWRTGGEVKGKLANGVGSQSPSLPRNVVYPALLPLMRTPRLPVVDWADAPADLNGLVRFAESRNLVSARVPSRFNRSLPCGRIQKDSACSYILLVMIPVYIHRTRPNSRNSARCYTTTHTHTNLNKLQTILCTAFVAPLCRSTSSGKGYVLRFTKCNSILLKKEKKS